MFFTLYDTEVHITMYDVYVEVMLHQLLQISPDIKRVETKLCMGLIATPRYAMRGC